MIGRTTATRRRNAVLNRRIAYSFIVNADFALGRCRRHARQRRHCAQVEQVEDAGFGRARQDDAGGGRRRACELIAD